LALEGVCKGLENFTREIYQTGAYQVRAAEDKIWDLEQKLCLVKDQTAHLAKEVGELQDELAKVKEVSRSQELATMEG
jgi:uncharacterized protein YlxW (UPF0749 family)